jgi:hypothetical protein
MIKSSAAKVVQLATPTDAGNETIAFSEPYAVRVTLEGSCDMLFHAWNAEAVDEKAGAAKNSTGKKTDNLESYIYRTPDGDLAIPGEYLRGSIINAAKFRQDPRSPRKSAMDLFKAAIVVTSPLASLGIKNWDYLDRRRVMIQRNGINRTRPAIRAGWQATFDFTVMLPEYVSRHDLRSTIESAGRLIGIGDFRPNFGRFGIIKYE